MYWNEVHNNYNVFFSFLMNQYWKHEKRDKTGIVHDSHTKNTHKHTTFNSGKLKDPKIDCWGRGHWPPALD